MKILFFLGLLLSFFSTAFANFHLDKLRFQDDPYELWKDSKEVFLKMRYDSKYVKDEKKSINLKYGNKIEICKDWEFSLMMIWFVHYRRGSRFLSKEEFKRLLQKCPQDYFEMVQELRKVTLLLEDRHVYVLPQENFFKEPLFSSVLSCTSRENKKCSSFLKKPIYPLKHFIGESAFYILIPQEHQAFSILKLSKIGNKNVGEIFEDLKENNIVISKGMNFYKKVDDIKEIDKIYLPYYYFSRTISDDRSFENIEFEAEDLESGEHYKITSSFKENIDYLGNKDYLDYITSFFYDTSYSCEKYEEYSDAFIGACVTKEKRLVIWVKMWGTINKDVKSITKFIDSFLMKNRNNASLPVILDISGNSGGNPYKATEFACRFFGDFISEKVNQRFLKVNLWPQKIKFLNGDIFDLEKYKEDFLQGGNSDLISIEKNWEVSSLNMENPKEYEVGFLERKKVGPSYCKSIVNKELASLKWVVMTNGSEVSAAEDFLSFIERESSKVKIIGKTTGGGSGMPLYFVLPYTKIGISLSQARQVDKKNKTSFLIEGLGIKPYQEGSREREDDFEKRIRCVFKNKRQEKPCFEKESSLFLEAQKIMFPH